MQKAKKKPTHYVNNSVIISSKNPENIAKQVPFAVVESYKKIRTNILFLLAQSKGKIVAVSSADAGEGKSTTTINIAVSFAQLNKKILLVDADMRRSSIHKKLKLSNNDGLSNILAGFSELDESVINFSENLDILTAGPLPPNPSELLSSLSFDNFIENSLKKYDYIFIDTPPVNIVSDALIIAPKSDGLILIARSGLTPQSEFNQALSAVEMANIKILGTILNGSESDDGGYFKYKKHKYGYSKYYKKKYTKYNYEYDKKV